MPRFLSFFSAVAFVGLALLSLPASASPDFIPIVAFLEDDNGPVNGEVDVDVYLGQWDNGGTSLVSTTVMVVDGLLVIEVPHLSISAAEADPFLNLVIDGEALAGDIPVGKVFFADHADSATSAAHADAAYSASTADAVVWSNITGRPAGLDDGDSDTTYTAQSGGGLALFNGEFFISTAGVTTTRIANEAVTGLKIANSTITEDDLATSSVGTLEVIDGSIASGDLANGAVTSGKLADDAVQTQHLATNAVNANAIATGAVTSSELASSSVRTDEIATSAVQRQDIHGTEVQVYGQAVGCGGGISLSSTCQTRMCNWISGGAGARFYDCDGTCPAGNGSPQSCSLTRVGYMLDANIAY